MIYEKVEEATKAIVRAFEDESGLPKPLAQVFLRHKDARHYRKWSWGNQLLVILRGYTDARGFRQWAQVGRNVRKGERAFHILGPIVKKRLDQQTGEEKAVVVGFKGIPVFGLEQTEGTPLPTSDPEADRWVESLPLIDVARRWGLSVDTFNGERAAHLGFYLRGEEIAVGVKNLSTWAHELVHAADDRTGSLQEVGQHWRSESVAELGASVLLELIGKGQEADLGGCWEYIQYHARQEGIPVVEACLGVLDRTCRAVSLILDTAEAIRTEEGASDQPPRTYPDPW